MTTEKRTVLDLDNPADARYYLDQFDWGLPIPPTYVVLSSGEEVHFDKMTDEQAVTVARSVYLQIQCKIEQQEQGELH